MIQDNQKNFTRMQMLIDAVIIAVCYVLAWMLRFIGPFAYSAVRALTFEQYMFALVFIIPGYLLLYQAFTLYEPLHMQGRRLVLANIIKANILGLLLIVFSLYMMDESDFSRLTVYIFCVINIIAEWICTSVHFFGTAQYAAPGAEPETDDTGRLQPCSRRIY